jgi:hypothetical protein
MATFNINKKFNFDSLYAFKKIMSFELFNFGNNYYAFIFNLNLEKKLCINFGENYYALFLNYLI